MESFPYPAQPQKARASMSHPMSDSQHLVNNETPSRAQSRAHLDEARHKRHEQPETQPTVQPQQQSYMSEPYPYAMAPVHTEMVLVPIHPSLLQSPYMSPHRPYAVPQSNLFPMVGEVLKRKLFGFSQAVCDANKQPKTFSDATWQKVRHAQQALKQNWKQDIRPVHPSAFAERKFQSGIDAIYPQALESQTAPNVSTPKTSFQSVPKVSGISKKSLQTVKHALDFYAAPDLVESSAEVLPVASVADRLDVDKALNATLHHSSESVPATHDEVSVDFFQQLASESPTPASDNRQAENKNNVDDPRAALIIQEYRTSQAELSDFLSGPESTDEETAYHDNDFQDLILKPSNAYHNHRNHNAHSQAANGQENFWGKTFSLFRRYLGHDSALDDLRIIEKYGQPRQNFIQKTQSIVDQGHPVATDISFASSASTYELWRQYKMLEVKMQRQKRMTRDLLTLSESFESDALDYFYLPKVDTTADLPEDLAAAMAADLGLGNTESQQQSTELALPEAFHDRAEELNNKAPQDMLALAAAAAQLDLKNNLPVQRFDSFDSPVGPQKEEPLSAEETETETENETLLPNLIEIAPTSFDPDDLDAQIEHAMPLYPESLDSEIRDICSSEVYMQTEALAQKAAQKLEAMLSKEAEFFTDILAKPVSCIQQCITHFTGTNTQPASQKDDVGASVSDNQALDAHSGVPNLLASDTLDVVEQTEPEYPQILANHDEDSQLTADMEITREESMKQDSLFEDTFQKEEAVSDAFECPEYQKALDIIFPSQEAATCSNVPWVQVAESLDLLPLNPHLISQPDSSKVELSPSQTSATEETIIACDIAQDSLPLLEIESKQVSAMAKEEIVISPDSIASDDLALLQALETSQSSVELAQPESTSLQIAQTAAPEPPVVVSANQPQDEEKSEKISAPLTPQTSKSPEEDFTFQSMLKNNRILSNSISNLANRYFERSEQEEAAKDDLY